MIPWTRCGGCENYWCHIHHMHAHDCPCPPIEEWCFSPYEDHAIVYSIEPMETLMLGKPR